MGNISDKLFEEYVKVSSEHLFTTMSREDALSILNPNLSVLGKLWIKLHPECGELWLLARLAEGFEVVQVPGYTMPALVYEKDKHMLHKCDGE
jgi:hypothetical protein